MYVDGYEKKGRGLVAGDCRCVDVVLSWTNNTCLGACYVDLRQSHIFMFVPISFVSLLLVISIILLSFVIVVVVVVVVAVVVD